VRRYGCRDRSSLLGVSPKASRSMPVARNAFLDSQREKPTRQVPSSVRSGGSTPRRADEITGVTARAQRGDECGCRVIRTGPSLAAARLLGPEEVAL